LPKPGLILCQERKGQEMEEVVNLLFEIFHANIEKKNAYREKDGRNRKIDRIRR
jgi:hypothetical protein